MSRPKNKRDYPLGGDDDLDQPAMCASRADITDVATNDPIPTLNIPSECRKCGEVFMVKFPKPAPTGEVTLSSCPFCGGKLHSTYETTGTLLVCDGCHGEFCFPAFEHEVETMWQNHISKPAHATAGEWTRETVLELLSGSSRALVIDAIKDARNSALATEQEKVKAARSWFNDELVRMKLSNELGGPKEASVREVMERLKP